MKFSVITVCRNSALTLPDTMRSLAVQTCTDYEWVVVDGGSTDETLDLVASFQGPRGASVSERDHGIYDAMNKGARMARGEYLFYLNSDDGFADANVLRDVAALLVSQPALDLIYGNVVYVHPERRVLRKFSHINRHVLPFEDLCHQAVFARRDLFERVGAFNERFRTNADYDWLLRVFASGAVTRWIDRDVAVFRTGGAHMQNLAAAVAERRAVRLQYMSSLALAVGDLRRRLRHRWHWLRTGQRPGHVPLKDASSHTEVHSHDQ